MRVIGQKGENLGVLASEEALRLAYEAGLDLIEISPTANPPVAKIMDRGKFLYAEGKKHRQAAKKHKEVETKNIRVGIGTSQHDLEMRAKQADEFLEEGDKVKINLALRGREKYLDKKFLEERIERVLALITKPFEKEDVKKGPRGLYLTISPKR